MSLELKDRIQAILNEFQKATAQRWWIQTKDNEDRYVVPLTKFSQIPKPGTLYLKPRHAFKKAQNDLLGRSKKTHSKIHVKGPLKKGLHSQSGRRFIYTNSNLILTSFQGTTMSLRSNIWADVYFSDLSKNSSENIVIKADTRLRIAETKIGRLMDRIWYSPEDDIEDCYNDINQLHNTILQYIVLNDEWSKKNSIRHDIDRIKNLMLYSNKIKNFQMVYIASKEEEEIPDQVYESMSFEDKIHSFLLMGENWDGEGAEAVSKTAVRNALNFLKNAPIEPCFVCSTYEGKVGIDFKNSNLRLETQIISSERMKCIIIQDGKRIVNNEIIPQSDFPKVLKLIKL